MSEVKADAALKYASSVQDRLQGVLDGSGRFWVESMEIDGLTDVRMLVRDREYDASFVLIAETKISED